MEVLSEQGAEFNENTIFGIEYADNNNKKNKNVEQTLIALTIARQVLYLKKKIQTFQWKNVSAEQ